MRRSPRLRLLMLEAGRASGEAGSHCFRVQGDNLDPRFLMHQVLQNSLMGSACMREEIVARRVAESLSGEMRDEGLSTAREWVPPCPHIPGARFLTRLLTV